MRFGGRKGGKETRVKARSSVDLKTWSGLAETCMYVSLCRNMQNAARAHTHARAARSSMTGLYHSCHSVIDIVDIAPAQPVHASKYMKP